MADLLKGTDDNTRRENIRVLIQQGYPEAEAIRIAMRFAREGRESLQRWGKRYGTEAEKGSGFFGGLKRPDGTGVMSEYSISDEDIKDASGKPLDYPSLVPTLTREEVLAVLNSKEGEKLPEAIYRKARDFAKQRIAEGKPLFALPGEQQWGLYPDLPRVASYRDAPLASSRQSVDPEALAGLLHQRGLGQR